MKIFFNVVGGIALALAALGVALPLLPTTPFLLVAAACFLRGSPRMHAWLTQNQVFGHYLRDYQEKKAVPLRIKVVAIGLMWLSLGYSMLFVVPTLKIPLGLIGLGVTAYLVLGLKTLPRSTSCGSQGIDDKTGD
ncbi:MAG TPA: YbaN family protein [Pusillimonas sp.]|uniref:YbaN family protein n=1 Tax=Pusillimonas sp. TaxID=3040095 RepID=UPI002BB27A85|nr:YbaN family protein [Pusillimonas sp.]HUH87086.1 YbaN family protein [Pusillimonas sp.]